MTATGDTAAAGAPRDGQPLLSVWLLAAPDDEADLSAYVEALARRFGTPAFRPHLTLAGDAAVGRTVASAALAALAGDHRAVRAQVASVDVGPHRFRAFYARFDAGPELAALREAAHRAVGASIGEPFLPHVSLAYGVGEGSPRASARAEVARMLVGRTVRFDRVALVASSSVQPVESWRVLDVVPLTR